MCVTINPAAVDHEARADIVDLHHIRAHVAHAGALELVNGFIVIALELDFHLNLAGVGRIEVCYHFVDGFAVHAAHGMPEDNLDGILGKRGRQEERKQQTCAQDEREQVLYVGNLFSHVGILVLSQMPCWRGAVA